mmetsp:Transcript_16651/g.26409  ORF Transcript_16651/g.26409 Transcript_16651/m.26409 type:complete len:114 (+) Transcript_16651:360-701(+)
MRCAVSRGIIISPMLAPATKMVAPTESTPIYESAKVKAVGNDDANATPYKLIPKNKATSDLEKHIGIKTDTNPTPQLRARRLEGVRREDKKIAAPRPAASITQKHVLTAVAVE